MLDRVLLQAVAWCWLGAFAVFGLQAWHWLKTAEWPIVTIAGIFRLDVIVLDWPSARGLAMLVERALSWAVQSEVSLLLFWGGLVAVIVQWIGDSLRRGGYSRSNGTPDWRSAVSRLSR